MYFFFYLCNTLWAAPVTLGHLLQGWNQTKSVVAVITAVAQQESILLVTSAAHQAQVEVNLSQRHM